MELIKNLKFIHNEDDYIAIFEDRHFKINKMLYLALEKFQETQSLEKTLHFLEDTTNERDLTVSELESYFLSFEKTLNQKPQQKESVLKILKLNSNSTLDNLIEKFSNILPSLKTFYFWLVSAFFLNTFFFTFFITKYYHVFDTYVNNINFTYLIDYIVFFIIFNFIVILHEFGHAGTAKKYGVDVKESGIGFYIDSFVLYVNLTKAWTLPKYQRIQINLGGIFIQLMIGVFIGLLLLIDILPQRVLFFIFFLFASNFLNLLFNLIPFFKTDGYWVYSDYFNLSNLRKRSYKLLNSVLIHRDFSVIKNTPKSLTYYTISFSIFIIFFIIQTIGIMIWLYNNYTVINIYYFYFVLFNLILLIIFTVIRKLIRK